MPGRGAVLRTDGAPSGGTGREAARVSARRQEGREDDEFVGNNRSRRPIRSVENTRDVGDWYARNETTKTLFPTNTILHDAVYFLKYQSCGAPTSRFFLTGASLSRSRSLSFSR